MKFNHKERTEELKGDLNKWFAELEDEKGEVSPGYASLPRAYALLCSLAGIAVDWRDQPKVWQTYETALTAYPEKETLIRRLLDLLQTDPIGR